LNSKSLEIDEEVAISKNFGVMHRSTAMVAKLKLKNNTLSENEMEKVEMYAPLP